MRRRLGALLLILLVVTGYFFLAGREKESGPVITMQLVDGRLRKVALEDYLIGVVAAEMPASFEEEALKAQAIAARTYVLRRMQFKANDDLHHPGVDICADPAHCQAWLPAQELLARWGAWGYLANIRKIKGSVGKTSGLVLAYEGAYIDPVYHSSNSGRTENAVDVWGNEVPYLISVPSPWDRESPHYRNEVSFTAKEINETLGTGGADPLLPPSMEVRDYTATGRIRVLDIGGKEFNGPELRRFLGLKSTDFTWRWEGTRVTFTTAGYGHGVGMSQYGANGMAWEGNEFAAILAHYYPGTVLSNGYARKE